MAFQVYTLSDPRTGNARYVGATSYPLKDRLARHCVRSELVKRNHRTNWIRGLQKLGLAPIIEPLEESSSAEEMFEAEEFWIANFLASGADLVNSDKGGQGRFGPRSAREREKMREVNLGRKHTSETKRKQSEDRKRRHANNPGWREAIRAANTGRVDLPETTERRRAARQARTRPVVHLNSGIIYRSARECAAALGVDRTTVYNGINHRYPSNVGHRFACV